MRIVIVLIFVLLGMMWLTESHAAEFCVTTTQELHDALAVADSNSEDDLIKIAAGNYSGGFYYNGDMDFDLTIRGGWTPFFDNPCFFAGNSAFETVLDGNNTERVMEIGFFGSSNVHVSHITFINGDSNPEHGGGLEIRTTNPNPTGRTLIENNVFINNKGGFVAALKANGGDRITVRNSLFVGNQATNSNQGSVVDLNNSSHGIYFNNNTVLNNTINGIVNKVGVRLVANGSGAFVANNILWNNDGADLRLLRINETESMLFNNNIEEIVGVFDNQANNYSIEPQFESGFLNFQPTLDSIEINRGGTPPPFIPVPTPFGFEWGLGDTDINGNARVQDGKVEIGAFEAAPEVPIFINGFE